MAATDAAANARSVVRVVRVDATAPVLTLTAPSNGDAVANSTREEALTLGGVVRPFRDAIGALPVSREQARASA